MVLFYNIIAYSWMLNLFGQRLNLHWMALKFKIFDDVMSDFPVSYLIK